MCRHATRAAGGLLLTFCGAVLLAQEHGAASTTTAAKQTEADEYTRYELLAPESASFKILYEVSATTPGAKVFYNPIRKGSVASDEVVFDAMSGEPLRFEVLSGAEARKDPLMADEDADGSYIKIQLARAVPPEGRGRLLIVKTYKDAKSYYREGEAIVFNRGLGIKRNSVVLPAGYELVGCNVPSQVLPEADGRMAISFMNAGPGEAPLVVRAKPGAQAGLQLHRMRQRKGEVGKLHSLGKRNGSGFRSARIRIATSFISCSSRKRMRSASIMTTRNRGQALTNT